MTSPASTSLPHDTKSHHHHHHALPPLPLPAGVTESYVYCPSNHLTFHVLEAGHDPSRAKPLLLLCHGYPELAFSWRKIMPALADAGYYVVAYDQRGYGRTTGWDESLYAKVDMSQFTLTQMARDVVILVHALGYTQVHCIIGHDFGAVTSSMCALVRPDLFKSVVMMSHPFKPPGSLPFNLLHGEKQDHPDEAGGKAGKDIQKELSKLPEPRKHYKWYNSTAAAALHWSCPVQGMHEFLRGYFHLKSADWPGNDPKPLKAWNAEELAKMPGYYIMPLLKSMPETVASLMQGEDASKTTSWLSDEDLDVYVQEWNRTGFQGGLNWYRTVTNPHKMHDTHLFASAKITVPSKFISGAQDWGNYQQPGALEAFPSTCTDFRGSTFIQGAGHWPQQEKPRAVVEALLGFLESLGAGGA